MRINVQDIIYPRQEKEEPDCLFYRSSNGAEFDGVTLKMKKNEVISFDTYFNSFSIKKWARYTCISTLGFDIKFCGQAKLLFYSYDGVLPLQRNKIATFDLVSDTFCQKQLFLPSVPSDAIVVAFELTSDSGCTIADMAYTAEVQHAPAELKLAVGFCTFKREDYINGNICELTEGVIHNSNSLLNESLDVYVADNGHTLDASIYDQSHIHVFQNPNYGGAGGFTRTIIESVIKNKTKPDYIILMDDDLILDYRVLERTYLFLSVLKEEFKQSMLGGALLSQEQRTLQVENGAYCGKDAIRHKVHGYLDLGSIENVVENQKTMACNYNGWFFCAIPTAVINEGNLPLPIFIHFDDVDYGCRNEQHELITLGGICIWHPDLQGKDPLWMNYYNNRNKLIHQSYRDLNISASKIVFAFLKENIKKIISYRYEEVDLAIQGVKAFYQGTASFKGTNPVGLHMNLIKNKYVWAGLPDSFSGSVSVRKASLSANLWGYLLPALGGESFVDKRVAQPSVLLKKRIWIVDENNQVGYVLEKSWTKTLHCLCGLAGLSAMVFLHHSKIWKEWNRFYPEMISYSYWKNYLEI